MKNNVLLAGAIGLIFGSVMTFIVVSNNQKLAPREVSDMDHSVHMSGDNSMSMQGMVDALTGKTGDDFDKEFITLMIEHHQGAIDMAKQANSSAKHDELRNLAEDIITTQTAEIAQMKQWLIDWGYAK